MAYKIKCDNPEIITNIKQKCFQRIQFRSFAYHKSDFEPFADLSEAQDSANWGTVQAGTDPNIVNVMPQILANGAITDGAVQKEGGNGDFSTASGVEEVTAISNPMILADIYQMNGANNTEINKLNAISQSDGVSVFLLDPNNDLVWGYLTDTGAVTGFPTVPKTLSITQGGGTSGEQTIKKFEAALPDNYDEKMISFSITGLTVQALLNQQAV